MNGLTQKQEKFTRNLFEGMNQSEAYRRAGYAVEKQTAATIKANASRLASNVNVKRYLDEMNQKAEDDSVAGRLERKQIATQIARGRFADFMTNLTPEKLRSPALQEIKITEVGVEVPVKTTTIKLHSPLQAIDLLNKMDRLYTDGANVNIDNRTLNINVNSEKTKDLTERLIAGERTDRDNGHQEME
jgi:phage terminase small subunit